MEEKIKIVIAEDNALFRQTVSAELQKYDVITIGQAANGFEVQKLLQYLDPDVLLLDLEMPELDGNKTFSIIKKSRPELKIIIFSQYDDTGLIDHYYKRGADGYLPKSFISTNVGILAEEIRKVKNSQRSFFYFERVNSKTTYTKRETEIIPLILQGRTSKEIGEELGLSIKSINKYRLQLHRKTETHNVAGFIRYAVKKGLEFLGKNNT